MNDEPSSPAAPVTVGQPPSALFATLVMQQANMAMIFLGKTPHPETGQAMTDINAASMFIDTLEMLAAKTKGNLSKLENDLLQQHLTMVRMAFVEAVDAAPPTAPAAPPPAPAPGAAVAGEQTVAKEAAPAAEATDDARKKFVKKY